MTANAGPRLPEPGRNASCLCGSGRKFKKCCGPRYRTLPRSAGGWQDALDSEESEEALAILRAEFSRYAMWHFLHTVPWRERDPAAAEDLMRLDILALGDYLDLIRGFYNTLGRHSEFPDVLARVASHVDDSRWMHQLAVQRALWHLHPDEDREGAKQALRHLDVDAVEDSKVLAVCIDVFREEFTPPQVIELCDRVIESAPDATYLLQYSVLKATLWSMLGESETAVAVISAALEQEGTEPDTLSLWGMRALVGALHLLGIHKGDDAALRRGIAVCDQALRTETLTPSGAADLLYAKGDVLLALGDVRGAMASFQASLDRNEAAPPRIALGRTHVLMEEPELARETFDAVPRFPPDAPEFVDLALAQYGLVLLPHDARTRERVRSDLNTARPRFPMHREAKASFLRNLDELEVPDANLMARLWSIWQNLSAYLIVQPKIFGIGVDLAALGRDLAARGLERHAERDGGMEGREG